MNIIFFFYIRIVIFKKEIKNKENILFVMMLFEFCYLLFIEILIVIKVMYFINYRSIILR